MRASIDLPEITNAECHRRDLRRVAARVRRHERNVLEPVDGPAAPLTAAERHRLLASLTEMWDAAGQEVERADPLGLWSFGPPRRPLVLPDARTLIDWGVWILVVLLTGGYLIIES